MGSAGPTLAKRISRESFNHFLIGFAILAKGIAKLEHHHDRPVEIVLIFLAGIFIFMGTVFHARLEKRIQNFTATFHLAEGLALVFIGVIYLREEGSEVQYFYFFLGIVYLAIGLAFFFSGEEKKERLRRQMRLWIGIAFLAAGAVTFVMNRISEGSPWANVIALIFAGAGLTMIVRKIRKRENRILKL